MKNAQILLVKPYLNLIGDQISGRSDTLVQYLLYHSRLQKKNAPIRRVLFSPLHKVFLLFSCVLCACKICATIRDSKKRTLLLVASVLLRCIKFFYCFSTQLCCLKNNEKRADIACNICSF